MSKPSDTQEVASIGEQALTPVEQKKRAKAEKQARRAAQKEQQGFGDAPATNGGAGNHPQVPVVKQPLQQKPKEGKQQNNQQQEQRQGKSDTKSVRGSSQPGAGSHQQMSSVQRRVSQSSAQRPAKKAEYSKQVDLFSHLYAQPRRHDIVGVSKDVHPAVLKLGLQMSSYEISGSNARCVGMLLAFQEAIRDYTTPAGTSLPRHLEKHYLSPQIDYLKSCRPISESMGNAIRWLKKLVVEIDPNTPEQKAKDELCDRIDTFISERITVTDQAIASSAAQQIKPRAVVLTFAKSSIVQRTILESYEKGVSFRVICVDSRPLFEGRALATSLMHCAPGLEVEYLPYSALSYAVQQATLVLLGAHSMLSNGKLMSRIGTASVAMQAASRDVPVIVLCESVKFSGKVALDSIVLNEVAPAEELIPPNKGARREDAQTDVPTQPKATKADAEIDVKAKVRTLEDWKDIANVQILNLMYDVTPAEYIRMVICEYGSLPPSSVPVVHRLANEGEI